MGWAKHLEFPLIDKTKKNILEESIENGYEQFLYETWSCWYPNEDNQPCGECALCEITIVETTLEIPKTII
jgi:7-cyano-7-deazaguanine synthase in queuosine biosynthesis